MFSPSSSSDEDFIALDSSFTRHYILNSKSIGIHPINKKRSLLGEFHHLYNDLRRDREKFFQYMRMKPNTFDYIIENIKPRLIKKWKNCHSQPISTEERLMLTLRYLSTGMSFRSLAFSFRMGKSTVANIISEVVRVLWDTLVCEHMKIPSEEDFKKIADDYGKIWNFPHCIGALDGKHIRIRNPPHSVSLFYNYKSYFSIVLQGLVDAHYKFINIDVGGYGRQGDGGTFQASLLYKKLTTGSLHLPKAKPFPGKRTDMPYVIIADGAYPLMTNLLKPYGRKRLTPDEEYFNCRLSRARRSVECAFGILTAKWEVLQKPIGTNVKLADDIVKCLCVLHNTIIDLEGMEHNLTTFDMKKRGHPFRKGRTRDEAQITRNAFKEYICQNLVRGD